MEGLTRLINRAVEIWEFIGFHINEDIYVDILHFIDDMVIIGYGSLENQWSVKAILRGFEMVSGLKVNFYKTKIFGINLCEWSMRSIVSFMSCCEDHLPFKFLGVMVGDNPRRLHMWKDVISNIRNILPPWRSRFLSVRGRVVMVNALLNFIPIYSLSFYKARVKVLKEIIRIQSNFLRGGYDTKITIH
ncbi:uncharacterized protein LOC131658261 [Vicia villosa]|uniref:uncharacterized protein LOC131658261 n=1 Tax=Vicia villosa TaxID=3911 RepID=UPI00273CF0BF|nr:uncharacterized protein LOC131658261 [Vicia villosa]